MKQYIFRLSLILPIGALFMILSATILNPKTDKSLLKNADQDSLKTINNYRITLLKDETIDLNISDWDYFYSTSSSNYKKGENQSISSNDYSFNFIYSDLINNDQLVTPEELNLHHPKSTSKELKSLMNFSFSKYSLLNGYNLMSWWRYYVSIKDNITLTPYNDENPDNYIMEKDKDGVRLDDKMMGVFHDFMRNKFAREIIYESIKQNFNLLNNRISVFQKRLLLVEINSMIPFCENYTLNRKKYLNGRTSVTDKPGEYDFRPEYGYETESEGFLFRRIEFDNVPPLELAQFLKELKLIIANSLNSSDFNSNMFCEINGGQLKINSYVNSKNKIGFLIRSASTTNSYFVPSPNIKLTKLEIKGKNYWRVVFDEGKQFITLDEKLVKI
jgi:hypothetical protein